MSVEFFNNTVEVKNAMKEQIAKFLEESGGLVEARAKQNTRTESGKTKNAWTHVVEGNRCTIGNPLENAIWEEFGTGENVSGGRKGGWWIPAWTLDSRTINLFKYKYHFKEGYGSNGKKYYFTEGKKGTQAFQKAWDYSKPRVKKRADEIFGELNVK